MPKAAPTPPFSGSIEADALLEAEPFALLLAVLFDAQVRTETAFSGPYKIQQRLGIDLAPDALLDVDEERLHEAFGETPAVHRFWRKMADRSRELANAVEDTYDGDAERIWTEAEGADDFRKPVKALPGFGDSKVVTLAHLLHHFGNVDFRAVTKG